LKRGAGELAPIATLRVGKFPHEAYVARCACLPDVGEIPTLNYHGHAIASPVCKGCGRRFELAIDLMLPPALATAKLSPPNHQTTKPSKDAS
jgi:hypothetical protein